MSKQLTLGAGLGKYARTTRRAQFLSEMDLLAPVYPTAGNGRPPRELEMMLRIYCLQQWFVPCLSGCRIHPLPVVFWASVPVWGDRSYRRT